MSVLANPELLTESTISRLKLSKVLENAQNGPYGVILRGLVG
jgi:hypothetical protein